MSGVIWPDKVRDKLRTLPDAPGCYLMRDRRGRIIYVGKAASLRKRVQSYFRQATLLGGAPKLRGLVKSVCDLEWIVVRNEAEAILTEGRLIKEYKPRYNVSFRDDKRFLLLRLDEREPFPRFELVRIRREDGATYFGPYASSAAARATLDFLEKSYSLRKCTPHVPGEAEYRHCLNDVIRFCSAPCVGRVTPEAYRERVKEACAFLRGERMEPLKELQRLMEEASAKLDFERAVALRDTLLLLRAAVKQKARMASTPEMLAEDARIGLAELAAALGLGRPPRVIEAFDISNISGTFAVASLVCAVDGLPRRNRYRRFRIRTVEGSDDPAMMAEVIRRRYTRVQNEGQEYPDLVLVDGGITQVRAARGELRALGLERVPVAGLAKRFEELHWRDEEPPVRLPPSSRALRVLQQLRDEAHRFALTYHRHLRSRRLRESVLDLVPGIGEKRKQLLLEHFHSAARLTAATEAEIAAVPGVGPVLAREIKSHLNAARPPADSAAEPDNAE